MGTHYFPSAKDDPMWRISAILSPIVHVTAHCIHTTTFSDSNRFDSDNWLNLLISLKLSSWSNSTSSAADVRIRPPSTATRNLSSTDPDAMCLLTTSTGISLTSSTTSENAGFPIYRPFNSLDADESRELFEKGGCLSPIWRTNIEF
ncbi:hypothetical protein BYT27DRAFT_6755007 [Phlegmacium glaucopus]|nr:hypothetical protein BYT27DRAFT_6755007 [Phlegmacium glaucopus]